MWPVSSKMRPPATTGEFGIRSSEFGMAVFHSAFRSGLWSMVCGLPLLLLPAGAGAAETTDPVPMSKTVIILALGSETPLAIRTKFQEQPPSLLLEFPPKRVIGSLPERSTLGRGAIEAILTN